MLVVTAAYLVSIAPAQAQVQPYATNDGGGFWNILPPGANGHANAVELGSFLAACPPTVTSNCPGAPRPPHSADELSMYGDLVYASSGLKREDLEKYFKDGLARERADVGAAMAADLGLVAYTAKREADELAVH